MAKKAFTRGAAIATARAMLRQGRPEDMVREHLLQRGATEEEADSVLEELSDVAVTAPQKKIEPKQIEQKAFIKYKASDTGSEQALERQAVSEKQAMVQQKEPEQKKAQINYDALSRTTKEKSQEKQADSNPLSPAVAVPSESNSQLVIGWVILLIGFIALVVAIGFAASNMFALGGALLVFLVGIFVTYQASSRK